MQKVAKIILQKSNQQLQTCSMSCRWHPVDCCSIKKNMGHGSGVPVLSVRWMSVKSQNIWYVFRSGFCSFVGSMSHIISHIFSSHSWLLHFPFDMMIWYDNDMIMICNDMCDFNTVELVLEIWQTMPLTVQWLFGLKPVRYSKCSNARYSNTWSSPMVRVTKCLQCVPLSALGFRIHLLYSMQVDPPKRHQ